MDRLQVLEMLRSEMRKWDDKYNAARREGRRIEKERADARSNEVCSVALLLGFTSAELLGSPFIAGSDADIAWRAQNEL
jgi:hypothetical protein